MRVLIDANTINTGKSGIGYYTYNLIRELSRLTDNSFDLTMAIRGNVWRMLEKNGFDNVHNLVVEEKHFRKYLPFPSQSLQGYDIFHEPNYVPRKFNGATVVTIADLSYRFFPQYHPWRRVKMLRLFEGRMRNASRIITISENSRREIEEVLRIPPERIKVTYLGADESFRPFKVDKDKKDEMIAKYGLPEHFVLFVGNIEPRKNLERLVQAYYLCRQEGNFPDEIKLVLAGGKGWLNEGVFSLVSSLGLDLDVIFTGYVRDEDLAVLYNMALAFVYPSLYEGFGLPPWRRCPVGYR
nr:glycosyltransferase family 1 protein [Syntrophomonas palmitatica]